MRRVSRISVIFLWGFIITYSLYFSWYAINRHNTLNSYAADLSLIDQPMWNTALGPGGFMELTWGNRQQPRLAEHFEPILVPLSFLFFLWDDVRILLIAQSVALALGALPVFWIARHQFITPARNVRSSAGANIAHWAALAFAAVYLLFPHLQAANIADFHADPFVVAPLLFTFWYATQHRWRWMWFWAVIAMLTKENLPTLTAMLGLWLLLTAIINQPPTAVNAAGSGHRTAVIQGITLIIISAVWFLAATFLIVTPLARQYFDTGGPIYFSNRFNTDTNIVALLQDPARWRYLSGLFAAMGFLPLLAPELLLLGLPVLAANLLSNFPGQYSGEQHYSAPLVAVFVLAAIYGTRRLTHTVSLREYNGQTLKQSVLIGATLWLLAWSIGYHTLHGWTPLSVRTEIYRASSASTQLTGFLTQIPADAVVSASAGIHPHLAHRRTIYVFPVVEDADYLLVDVTDIPGIHPNDARAKLIQMLNADWQLLDASNGLILARKGTPSAGGGTLPQTFYNFTNAATPPATPVSLAFGDNDGLQLLGYDVLDDPDDGVVFRFYWQTGSPLSHNLKLWPLLYTDSGQLLNNPTQIPMIATVWYFPEEWQPGQIVVTETLPQLLPSVFHLGVAAGITDAGFYDIQQRLPLSGAPPTGTPPVILAQPGRWVQLATFYRQGPFLTQASPTPNRQPLQPVNARFGPSIQLTGYQLNNEFAAPGLSLPILLNWTTGRPVQTDYTVFIHLLAPDSTLAAQSDAYPTWLTPQPTSQWPVNRPIPDSHTLHLPPDLPPGTYTLQLGLYNAQTMERLPLSNGNTQLQLTNIRVK